MTINYSADLRLVSDIVGAPIDELIALNPSLLRLVTPPDTGFDLHLPAGTAALFHDKIAAIPESKRNSWRYHKVTPDDTLASIAHTYSVSVSALAQVNQIDQTEKLDGVEAIVVPVAPAAAPSAHTVYYTTRRGDTLVSVADRFGISLTQLRRWNKLPPAVSRSPRAAAFTLPNPPWSAPAAATAGTARARQHSAGAATSGSHSSRSKTSSSHASHT